MLELDAITPCCGMMPLEIGAVRVGEEMVGKLTSLSPYQGQHDAMSDALKSAHGMVYPAPCRMSGKAGARVIWFGHETAMLMGPNPDAVLAQYGAVTDQSDAWVVLRVDGADARAVLARLTPLDIRKEVFARGATARTEISHMAGSLTRLGADSFIVMVFRSHAQTLAHHLETAMQGVAGRRGGSLHNAGN